MAMRFEQSQGMKLGQSMKLSPRHPVDGDPPAPHRRTEERIEQELENNIALELAEPERDDLDEPINREEATDADSDSFEHLEDLARDNPDYAENAFDTYRQPAKPDGERDAKTDAMANARAPAHSTNNSSNSGAHRRRARHHRGRRRPSSDSSPTTATSAPLDEILTKAPPA